MAWEGALVGLGLSGRLTSRQRRVLVLLRCSCHALLQRLRKVHERSQVGQPLTGVGAAQLAGKVHLQQPQRAAVALLSLDELFTDQLDLGFLGELLRVLMPRRCRRGSNVHERRQRRRLPCGLQCASESLAERTLLLLLLLPFRRATEIEWGQQMPLDLRVQSRQRALHRIEEHSIVLIQGHHCLCESLVIRFLPRDTTAWWFTAAAEFCL